MIGRSDPAMTPELARTLLPDGPHVPWDLLHRLGTLLTPSNYADTSGRELIALGDAINAAADRSLRAAQRVAERQTDTEAPEEDGESTWKNGARVSKGCLRPPLCSLCLYRPDQPHASAPHSDDADRP